MLEGATFPGAPESVGRVREYVRTAVAQHGPEVVDVAELLASETATNSVIHSRSGRPGGHIAVSVASGDGTLRVQVLDQGSEDSVPLMRADANPMNEHGHGLVLVKSLATRWGTHPAPDGGRLTWFELDTSAA